MSRERPHDPAPSRITCHLCALVWSSPWPTASWAKHWKRRHATEGSK